MGKNIRKDDARKRSLENLKKGNRFTSETAKLAAPKAAQKKKENNFYRKEAAKRLDELLSKGAMESVIDIDRFKQLKPFEQLAILQHLADYSGQKPKDIPEAIVMPVINIKGL